jgi:hypothetical protein
MRSGVDAHRVHALQGCEWRAKTHRLQLDHVDAIATVSPPTTAASRSVGVLGEDGTPVGRGGVRRTLGLPLGDLAADLGDVA